MHASMHLPEGMKRGSRKEIVSPVLRTTCQQLNKVFRDKRCVYFLFFHTFIQLLMQSGSQPAYFLKQLI